MEDDDLNTRKTPGTTILQVRVRADEKAAIRAEAERRDIGMSELVRRTVLRDIEREAG